MQKDLISKQEAVELTMKYCPDDDGTVQCEGDIRGLLDELENLPPAQPELLWIPCEEEMPKEKDAGILQKIGIQNKSDNVFVTIDIEKGKIVEVACTWDGMWKWDGVFAFPKWKVVAWMPFPAPYQGGETE